MSAPVLARIGKVQKTLNTYVRQDEAQRAFIFTLGVDSGAILQDWLQDAGNLSAFEAMTNSLAAMSEVAASPVTMDAVVASQTAMDAVVASQTAMDAVAASQTAMGSVLSFGDAATVFWESSIAINALSTTGSPPLPNIFTTSDGYYEAYASGSAIVIDYSGGSSDGTHQYGFSFEADLASMEQIRVVAYNTSASGTSKTDTNARLGIVAIGGNETVLTESSIDQTIDVSGYSGPTSIELQLYNNTSSHNFSVSYNYVGVA